MFVPFGVVHQSLLTQNMKRVKHYLLGNGKEICQQRIGLFPTSIAYWIREQSFDMAIPDARAALISSHVSVIYNTFSIAYL